MSACVCMPYCKCLADFQWVFRKCFILFQALKRNGKEMLSMALKVLIWPQSGDYLMQNFLKHVAIGNSTKIAVDREEPDPIFVD